MSPVLPATKRSRLEASVVRRNLVSFIRVIPKISAIYFRAVFFRTEIKAIRLRKKVEGAAAQPAEKNIFVGQFAAVLTFLFSE